MKRGFKSRKAESLLLSQVVMIILTILFFSMLMYFVYDASKSALFVQKVYAKQIALLIDNSRPGMEISVDFKEGFETAKKISKEKGTSFENLVSYSDGGVLVNLGKSKGFFVQCFNDYDVEIKEDKVNEKILIIVK